MGLIEGWSLQDSIYFAFVSGLTIGYGDLLTGLVAAVAVKALTLPTTKGDGKDDV